MSDKTIRVLVVDDSAVMREVICDLLSDVAGVTVVGTACDGNDALTKAAELSPDIVTLDVQMPGMDGIETLDALLAAHPRPVIMVSSLTQRAADLTFQLLDRGALDYVPKPDDPRGGRIAFRDELIHKLRVMAGADVERVLRIRRAKSERALQRSAVVLPSGATELDYRDCCIAIGISTGGPPALSELFQNLDPPLPPIVVVQHMPPNFTGPFARRLDAASALSIKEAESGDVLQPGHVLIAPGGKHLHLVRQGPRVVAKISDADPVSGHKPSIDVLFRSAASVLGNRCLGVIMTGMGHDGSAGCAAIRSAGGFVLGQDEASSDVYGMNRVAFVSGHVDSQFALAELPRLLTRHSRREFATPPMRLPATVNNSAAATTLVT